MGGFTVNGFGAADSYYPLKPVGNFYCKCCRKEQQFSVMELKRKIKILYIPTVSLYSKFAVACDKCKNGYYIDEASKVALLYGMAVVTGITENGPEIVNLQGNNSVASYSQSASAEKNMTETTNATVAAENIAANAAVQNVREKPEPIRETITEKKNIVKAAEPIAVTPTKSCPVCGFSYVGEPETCVLCGAKLS